MGLFSDRSACARWDVKRDVSDKRLATTLVTPERVQHRNAALSRFSLTPTTAWRFRLPGQMSVGRSVSLKRALAEGLPGNLNSRHAACAVVVSFDDQTGDDYDCI